MEFFSDIKDNKEEGASSLLTLAMKKLLDFVSSQSKVYPSDMHSIISELKYVRPSMVILKNYAKKIELFLNEFSPNEDIREQMRNFISGLIEELIEKRKKIVIKGVEIVKKHQKVSVVSYSSILKEILDNFSDKHILALYYDEYAIKLKGKNKFSFVGENEIVELTDIGIMGADAIIISEEGKFVVNGYPSSKFCALLVNKPVFVFAEHEKIVTEDVQLEIGFEKVKIGENVKIISV